MSGETVLETCAISASVRSKGAREALRAKFCAYITLGIY
jgi:hypothetical protein